MQLAFAALVDLLLIPYFGWGIYMLRRRFRYHDDLSPGIQAVTLAGVAALYLAFIPAMDFWLHNYPLLLMFSVLGLVVSSAALYGHMAVSLASWFLVDFFLPVREPTADQPRLGPIEALERVGDFEDALEGYLVLARIYPRDPEVPMRVAEVLTRLGRGAESRAWVERAVARVPEPEAQLEMVVRGSELLERKAGNPAAARSLLQAFIAAHPRAPATETALERLAHVGGAPTRPHSRELAPLAGSPLHGMMDAEPEPEAAPRAGAGLSIVPLSEAALADDAESAATAPEQVEEAARPRIGVAPIAQGGPLEPLDEDAGKRGAARLQLDRSAGEAEPGADSEPGTKPG